MALTINVCRTTLGDCTNCGISSRFDQLMLLNVEGPDTPEHLARRPNTAPAYLVKGAGAGVARIIPATFVQFIGWLPIPEKRWTMMGGNYAATSDSRFSEAVEKITGHPFYGAVAVHDRIEG